MATFTFPASGAAGSAYSRALRARTIGVGATDLTPDAPPVGAVPGSPRYNEWLRAGGNAGGPPAADTGLLERITESITSNQALAAQNEANARATATQAEGYQREIEAYRTVGSIAEQNATYEGISGNIKQLQAGRAVQRTLGKQRAQTASAGFANAAGSLDILRSSMQEGYLQDQLIRSQTAIAQGGYFQEAAAAEASGAGAQLASDAALELSRGYTSAGQLATATAAQQTSALQQYLKSTGGITDPTRALVTSTLGGPSTPTNEPDFSGEPDFTSPFSRTDLAFRPGMGQRV